jgi:hypothetical protein
MDGVLAIAMVVLVATALAAIGVRVGMLLAPRVESWGTPAEPQDEEPTADDRR